MNFFLLARESRLSVNVLSFVQRRVDRDVKWKVSGARQGLAPVRADYRGHSVRSWILCLVFS